MRVEREASVILSALLILAVSFVPFGYAAPPYYRSYDTLIHDFKVLAESYPSLVTYEVIGKSVLGKDILMFKIGNPLGGRVVFDGTMHGTENLGGELLYYYAKWLLTSNDQLATRILQRDYTLLVPVLNIEGMLWYTRTNANEVDLNRNFATNWESGSSDPDSDTYRGPAPLSEPESRALLNIFRNYKPSFYLNLHMWGGPYYAGSSYAERAYYDSLVAKVEALSRQLGVTPYPYSGQLSGSGFAIGDAARLGITSFLMELGRTIYSTSEIETIVLRKFIPFAAILSQECEGSPQLAIPNPWDINRDGLVELSDLILISSAYGATPTSPNWDPRANIFQDGLVDVFDLGYVAGHFGQAFDTLLMPFDESNNTVIKDYSGYGNNGAINGATWTPYGLSGGAYNFDGNDCITVKDAASLDGASAWLEISIDFWIKPEAALSGARLVAKKNPSASTGSYMVGFQSSGAANTLFFGVTANGRWEEIVYQSPLAINNWYHVVCSYKSGSGLTIYIDGIAKINRQVSGFVDPGQDAEHLIIGYDGGGGSNKYFIGELDEIRITPAASINYEMDTMQLGVSYSSNNQRYSDTTDAILDRDFSLFAANGIQLISLNVIWRAVEPTTKGVYDSAVVKNLKRVLAKAEQYQIRVLFSFHTHFQEQAVWSVPAYVKDPYTGKQITLAIVRSAEMKEAYLNYVQYVVSQVRGSTAIEAWSLLNEPMYWWDSGLPRDFSHKLSFQQLMVEGKALINSLDSRPVIVKFALPDSPWSGDFDISAIMQIFDSIIALNVYIDPITGKDEWGMTLSDLNRAVGDCKAYGKLLWITEFGKGTLNDEVQRVFFREAVSILEDVGVDLAIAWTWIHDHAGLPDSDCAWSISYDGGSPRPAFYELKTSTVE